MVADRPRSARVPFSAEERRLVAEAVAAGRVRRIEATAWPEPMTADMLTPGQRRAVTRGVRERVAARRRVQQAGLDRQW